MKKLIGLISLIIIVMIVLAVLADCKVCRDTVTDKINEIKKIIPTVKIEPPKIVIEPAVTETTPALDTSNAPVDQSDVQVTTNPQVNNSNPQNIKDEYMGHILFTQNEVTPGDPASYIGTVGQCPFYEMAGDKGCMPPADIKCNADWSVCEYVGGK